MLKAINVSYLTIFILIVIASHFNKNASVQAADDLSHNKSATKSGGLHRLDFRIEGKSCAACLLSIQRKLNSVPGVKQAVVMLKRPFGASVIYDSNQISQDELIELVKTKEATIRVADANDIVIDKMPQLVIPPFVPSQENK